MAGRITVVGLGPGDPTLRTVGSQRALDGAARIILRTRIHPGLDDLTDDPRVTSCDDLYDRQPSFEALYEAVADRVCDAAVGGDVVFAVPGHPRFGEATVRLLVEHAAASGVPVDVLDAVSSVDVIANALGVDPLAEGLQLIDAVDLVGVVEREPYAGGLLLVDAGRPCLLSQVFATHVATAAKLALTRVYPDDHLVAVVRAASVSDEHTVTHCALYQLDRQPVDHLTSVWIPALPELEAHRSPRTLQRIVARLRAPGGCPWDRKQTHASLRDALLEEAFEATDAVDAGDADNLQEELGDLVLLAAMHAQIAEERGDFALEDVYESVTRKLVRRHPHVFGDVTARTAEEVVQTWDAAKARERNNRGAPRPDHPIDRLPRSMPALMRATTLLRDRCPETGAGSVGSADELGDALLDAVEAAVRSGVDPERLLIDALHRRIPNYPPAAEGGATPTPKESLPA